MSITSFITIRCTGKLPPPGKKHPYLALLAHDSAQLSGFDYQFTCAHKNRCMDKEQRAGSRETIVFTLRAQTGQIFEARLAFMEHGVFCNKMVWFEVAHDGVYGLANKAAASDRLYYYRSPEKYANDQPLYKYYELHRLIRPTIFKDPSPDGQREGGLASARARAANLRETPAPSAPSDDDIDWLYG